MKKKTNSCENKHVTKLDKLKRLISDRSTNSEDEEENMPKLQGLLSKLEENLDDMKNMTVKVEPLDPFEA